MFLEEKGKHDREINSPKESIHISIYASLLKSEWIYLAVPLQIVLKHLKPVWRFLDSESLKATSLWYKDLEDFEPNQ